MPNAYFYSNTALPTTLTGSISSGATTLNVGATTGFPGSFPYILAVDYGAGTEELVSVSSAAGLTLTVVRGFGGTSAQTHSLGAVVRHVYNSVDATDFRTHEAATASVHGVTGALVGATQTQTLTNKTLTSPVINSATYANGGSFAGTYTGTPTFSGAVVFSGTPSISTGAALAGTFTGTPAFSGALTLSGSPLLTSLMRGSRGVTTDSVYDARVTADANARWAVRADGRHLWGGGSGVADTALYRSGAGGLTTDGQFEVGGDLVVHGIGSTLFARKTSDTARNTVTMTDDPHLTVSVAANAVYEVEGMFHWITTDETNGDLNIDFTAPSGATGTYLSFAQPPAAGDTTIGEVRTMSTDINAARTFGADSDAGNPSGMLFRALLVTAGSGGTYALQFARVGSAGTLTMLANSYLRLRRVA